MHLVTFEKFNDTCMLSLITILYEQTKSPKDIFKRGNPQMATKEKLVEMYRQVLRIRHFEEKVYELYGQNLVPGTIHLYVGQEAVAAGVCANLRKDDYITSTHRGHGHCISKGADLKLMVAEIMGRATGYCKGRGGSMHIAEVDKQNNLGSTGIVGGNQPPAVGAAMAPTATASSPA